jgi:alpha-galactosidase
MSAIISHTENNLLCVENDHLKLEYDLETGCFNLKRSHAAYPQVQRARAGLSCAAPGSRSSFVQGVARPRLVEQHALEDVHGKGVEFHLVGEGTGARVGLALIFRFYEERPFILMRLVATNHSGQTLHLDELTLIRVGYGNDGRLRFVDGDRALSFFKVGWHDWVYSGLRRADQKDVTTRLGYFTGKMLFNPAMAIGRRRGEFWGEGWGVLTDQKTALVIGFITTADQFGLIHADCSPRLNALSLSAQADGVLLQAGGEYASEWGYVQFVDLPAFDPAKDYVEATARQMQARLPATPPPAKWTHWYHYFQSITEDLFVANLEAIDRIRDVIPFRTVQLDDGYQSAWGDWDTCNAKFPHGLEHLAGRIRQKGYTAGLWLAPFVVDPRSRLAQEHPDWLVKDKKGKPIRSGFFYQFFGYTLDASHPAAQEHVVQLLDKIAHQWGFGFVKTDFVYAGALPGVRHDRSLTRAQVFRKGMQAVRTGIGEETFLLGCGCPYGPAIGIVDAIRVGPDTAPIWRPYLWSVSWATPLIKNEMSIASLRNNIRHTLNMSPVQRRWWWNDPDCLMVRDYDTQLTEAEVKSNVSLVGLSGGLLIHSDDLTRLSPERQSLVGLLLPNLSGEARPLDWLEREMAELYDMPMRRPWGDWHVVAVFNWNDRAEPRDLDVTRLGFSPDDDLHIFDFWNSTCHRHRGASFPLGEIPPHGCRLLRLCRAGTGPLLVGSRLHITQGGEVQSWQASAEELGVEISDLGRKVEGEIWFWLPEAPMQALVNGELVAVVSRGEGIYEIGLDFQGSAVVTVRWR